MNKSKFIPQNFTQTTQICKEQSEIKASKFVIAYNQGKKYGERIISSQMHTINTIITDYWRKAKHRQASGRRLYITVGNLAEFCKCSVKTVYNHIKRLIDARILKKSFTLHKFNPKKYTPCLLLEINPRILHFQVTYHQNDVENPVDNAQLELPIIPADVKEKLRQMGIWTDGA